MKLTIHTDGGARGNPGPAAVGVVIETEKNILTEFGKTLGETTNNVAEYSAVIEALTWIKNNSSKTGEAEKNFFLDSNLVVNQLNGKFKINDMNLRKLFSKAKELEQEVGGVIHYSYIPREQNSAADALVNKALDEQLY